MRKGGGEREKWEGRREKRGEKVETGEGERGEGERGREKGGKWERERKSIQGHSPSQAGIVWDPHHQDVILKIEMVQRRAARWVLGDYSPYSSVTDML